MSKTLFIGLDPSYSASTVPYVSHFMAHAPIVDGSPAVIEIDRAAPQLASNISSTTGGTVTTVIGCNFAVTSWSLSARFGFTVAAVTTWWSDSAISHKIARGVGAGSSPHRLRFCGFIFLYHLCYIVLYSLTHCLRRLHDLCFDRPTAFTCICFISIFVRRSRCDRRKVKYLHISE